MKKEDLLAVLRLKKCAQIGDTISKKLISLVGSPSGIFEEKSIRLQKIDGIGERLISNLSDERNLSSAERELEFILNQNIDYSYFLDADYPEYLKHLTEGHLLSTFDFKAIEKERAAWGFFRDRRPDLYVT